MNIEWVATLILHVPNSVPKFNTCTFVPFIRKIKLVFSYKLVSKVWLTPFNCTHTTLTSTQTREMWPFLKKKKLTNHNKKKKTVRPSLLSPSFIRWIHLIKKKQWDTRETSLSRRFNLWSFNSLTINLNQLNYSTFLKVIFLVQILYLLLKRSMLVIIWSVNIFFIHIGLNFDLSTHLIF